MHTGTTQLWVALLCVAGAIAVLTVIVGFFVAWRKGSAEEDPIPHCNLQERLAQIAQVPMVQARKTDLGDPVATPGGN